MSNKLAPIATRVLYEDDQVRIWDQVVPSGVVLEKHEHEHDYFLINLQGEGPFDVEFHDGTGGELGDRITFSPTPGTADFVPGGHIETAHNTGGDYRAILVELKQRKT
ncbi:MAG: hypothetical protein ACPHTD_10505 [Gammaproteobacteria bacterium]